MHLLLATVVKLLLVDGDFISERIELILWFLAEFNISPQLMLYVLLALYLWLQVCSQSLCILLQVMLLSLTLIVITPKLSILDCKLLWFVLKILVHFLKHLDLTGVSLHWVPEIYLQSLSLLMSVSVLSFYLEDLLFKLFYLTLSDFTIVDFLTQS